MKRSESLAIGIRYRIPWDKALDKINYYLQTQNHALRDPEGGTVVQEFSFPVSVMKKFLEKKAEISKIFIGLGVENDSYTIILAGIDFNHNLLLHGSQSIIYKHGSNQEIDCNAAKVITFEYWNNHAVPYRLDLSTAEDLKGCSFPLGELELVLRPDSQDIPTSVLFKVAYHQHAKPGFNDEPGYTLIMVGANSNGIPINTDTYAYDFCDPCPKICPGNNQELYPARPQ